MDLAFDIVRELVRLFLIGAGILAVIGVAGLWLIRSRRLK